jgi:group I intron endonuclease
VFSIIRKGVIYKYISPSNKVYVGMTIDENGRKYQHEREAINFRTNSAFHKSIRKYGFENFVYEVLFEYVGEKNKVVEKLCEKEREYIKKFNSLNKAKGYNLVDGGTGGNKIIWTKEKREERSSLCKGSDNSNAKTIDYYSENPVQQGNFKRTCNKMNWKFENFDRIQSGRSKGGKILYKYILKS